MSKQKHYYVTGNTSNGFVNYLSTNLKNIDQVIVLKHDSHTFKTAILQGLLQYFTKLGKPSDIIYSPFGGDFLEGVIIRDLSLAVITDTVISPQVKQFHEIELLDSIQPQQTNLEQSTIRYRINEFRESAYEKLKKGLKVHDDLETIYIREMNFDRANELSDLFIKDTLQGISKTNTIPHIYHRLFGTNTDQGAVNLVPRIIEPLSKRVYIKGRAGTGKSVFMKKFIKACLDHGLDIEQYHCSFDPDSIDMVLVPSLDLCVFDSTAPHEFSPERKEDIVIDLYKETVTPGTDEKHGKEIKRITQKYKSIVREGIEDLKSAKFWQDKLEHPYKHIDQTEIAAMTNKVLDEI